jgi:HEAT repeat protein
MFRSPRFLATCAFLAALALAGCKKPTPVVDDAPGEGSADVAKRPEAKKPLDQVVAELKDKKLEKRTAAVSAIGKYDQDQAVPALLKLLADTSVMDAAPILREPNSAREAGILALQEFGARGEAVAVDKGLPILLEGLKNSDPTLKEHTLLAIQLLGPKAKAKAGALLVYCEDDNESIRRAAFNALEQIGGVDGADFALMLTNSNPKVALDAARALNAVRPLPKDILPLLVEMIDRPPPVDKELEEIGAMRMELAEAIGSFGKDAEPAVAALVKALAATTAEDFDKYFRPPLSKGGPPLDELPTMAALRKIGKPAVPAMIEWIKGDKQLLQWLAARVLAGIGADASAALPALQAAFDKRAERGDAADVFFMAAFGLAIVQFGNDPATIVGKIAGLMEVASAEEKFYAASVLAFFGRKAAAAAPALIKLLDDEEILIRKAAVKTLSVIGPGAKLAVPALAKKLSTETDVALRNEILEAFRSLGPSAADAAPELSKLLRNKDEGFRRDVLTTIAELGPTAKVSVTELIRLIGSDVDDRDRLLAIKALGMLGTAAKSAIAPLLTELRERKGSAEIPPEIVVALGRIGVPSPEVLSAFSEQLKGSKMVERKAVARAIAYMGPAAKGATADLEKFASSSDPVARVWAATALYKIGVEPNKNVQIVMSALKDHSPAGRAGRLASMDVADLLGPALKSMVSELITTLGDKSPALPPNNLTPICVRAARALGKLGPAAKDAVVKLTSLLRELNPDEKEAAIEALGQIGPDAKFAAARLREIVRNEPRFAEKAAEALDKIENK